MATRQQPHPQQSLPQAQKDQRERYTPKTNTPQVYTLYPDPPLRRTSVIQLPPSPSQVLPKEKKSSTPKATTQTNTRHHNTQPVVSTQGHSPSTKLQSSPQQQYRPQQHQQQAIAPSPKNTLPSPISPSSSAPLTFTNRETSAMNDVARYDRTQYQHPRQTAPGAQPSRQQGPTPQMDTVYGGAVPRQTGPSAPTHKHGQSFSGSHPSSLSPSSAASGQYQNGLKQNTSASNPPRPGQLPPLQTDIPSSNLYLSFDREEQEHQQQALQYQQRLRQKPPKQSGEDTDDDSDSGSILSYRRSVHRMSMTYKGRPGVPNISLFAPNQRPQIVQYSRSPTESPIKELEVADENGSGSSLASIDQHRHQARHADNNKPRAVRAFTNDSSTPRSRETQVPERSVSVDDNIYKQNSGGSNSGSRSRQPLPPHWKDNPYPTNYHPDNAAAASTKSTHLTSHVQYEPRPSHESAQNMRSNFTRARPEPQNGSDFRSMSPTRVGGGGGGMSHHPMPPATRGVVKGGYVRPEEAMGPSNPMPERAEDFVRKGIEHHEDGDLTKATNFFRKAAELGDPVGMLMYGLSVRHGWGCTANRLLAFQYLQKSAEHAVGDLHSRDTFASTVAKGELVLAIYELGVCFRHGWGAEKNKKMAAYYFEIAANLGDADAQNDLAWCFYHGVGVKKDMYKSAKYYRMAAAQGAELMGNSWIWKDKYGGPSSPTPTPVDKKSISEMIPMIMPHN